MKADPSYLTDEKIRIFNKEGQEVDPATINWNTNEATQYKYRQDMGADLNSLGFVRINIPNPYGVYMHDTPSKGIFGDDFRFVSSGCVRVQDVARLCRLALKGQSRVGPRPDRRSHPLRPAARRQADDAGARLLGLHHCVGHARRRRPVPPRHLSARRRGPRPACLRGSRAAAGAAAGVATRACAQAPAPKRRG